MKKYIIFFVIFLTFFYFSLQLVSAQDRGEPTVPGAGIKSPPVVLTNPLDPKGEKDLTPQTFIGQVINGVLGIVGSLALAMFIYGGVIWMTAAGNAEQVTKGKNVLIWATLGIVIIFSSYALVRFVLYDLVGAPVVQTTPAS